MKYSKFFLLVFFLSSLNTSADQINFPPELLWWINEVKKANENIEVNSFVFTGTEGRRITPNSVDYRFLRYPVFMRWNYSGNNVAYYNYNYISLQRQNSGKYTIGDGDVDSILFIANRNRDTFILDSFGSRAGLDAIQWVTDTVLVGVGIHIAEEYIDLFINSYRIDYNNNTIEINRFYYDNAFPHSYRNLLRLRWYEQRPDYFEIRR